MKKKSNRNLKKISSDENPKMRYKIIPTSISLNQVFPVPCYLNDEIILLESDVQYDDT